MAERRAPGCDAGPKKFNWCPVAPISPVHSDPISPVRPISCPDVGWCSVLGAPRPPPSAPLPSPRGRRRPVRFTSAVGAPGSMMARACHCRAGSAFRRPGRRRSGRCPAVRDVAPSGAEHGRPAGDARPAGRASAAEASAVAAAQIRVWPSRSARLTARWPARLASYAPPAPRGRRGRRGNNWTHPRTPFSLGSHRLPGVSSSARPAVVS